MAIDIKWGNKEKTYVYARFHPRWTWKDNANTRKLYVEMMKTVPHRVDIIADFTGVSTLPANMFVNIRKLINDKLPNEGYFIMLGTGSFIQNMYQIIVKIIPKIVQQYIIVDTLDKAFEIVASGRSDEELAQK